MYFHFSIFSYKQEYLFWDLVCKCKNISTFQNFNFKLLKKILYLYIDFGNFLIIKLTTKL